MKDTIKNILIVVFAIIAAACGGYLIWYYTTVGKTQESYDKAKEKAVIDSEPDDVLMDEEETDEAPVIPVDFESLKSINPDVYAWIKVDGTTIDYPIVQSREDDNYYLNHTWEGKRAPEGAIFTQACNDISFQDFNTVIYGHQMGEGVETMFHQLNKYLDSEFMEEYPEVLIYTPDHIRKYQIFAAVVYDDRHLIQSFNYIADSEKEAFLDSIYNSRDMRNQYRDGIEVTTDDRIISLSTCITGESNHRLLIEAVLTDEK